jgi:hypothetical protein
MELALNYSHQEARLYTADSIQKDFFKCPDWPELIARASALAPVAFHKDV